MNLGQQQRFQESCNELQRREVSFKRQRPSEETDLTRLYNAFIIDNNEDEVLADFLIEFSLVFTRSCFRCLQRSALTAKVITAYMAMLQKRDQRYQFPGKPGSVFLSSWFFPDLYALKDDLNRLQLPKSIFDKYMVFMPVELRSKSWILCAIHMQNKRVTIYKTESSVFNEDYFYGLILDWLQYESRGDPRLPNKPFVPFNKNEWQKDIPNNLMQQAHQPDDSGVFILLCIEFLSVGLQVPICDESFLKAFRERIGVSLLTGKMEETPGVWDALNMMTLQQLR